MTIDLTPAATTEMERLKSVTGLTSADIFRHAFTLFRLYADARREGKEFRIVDPSDLQLQTRLELPVTVSSDK